MTQGGSDKLWGGRFSADVDRAMLMFSESTEADGYMVGEDIWGSEAHALMLGECGILSAEHRDRPEEQIDPVTWLMAVAAILIGVGLLFMVVFAFVPK